MYRLLMLIALAGLLLGGCQTGGTDPGLDAQLSGPAKDDTSLAPPGSSGTQAGSTAQTLVPGLGLSSEQRFSDVPLPMDLKEDSEHSYVFESESLQMGKIVYHTHASVADLSSFYLRECPAAEWKLDNKLESGTVYMVFLKPGKRLLVTIERKHGCIPYRLLTLNLTPDSGTKAGL